jgi:hypothetical protein
LNYRAKEVEEKKRDLVQEGARMAKFCNVDVALILCICKARRDITYNSIDLESRTPPRKK